MGFFTTIQNIIEVAKLSAYLPQSASCLQTIGEVEIAPCEDVLRVVIPQVHSRRSADGYTLGFALVVCEQVRRCENS
jgi:hypothetical protein